VSFIGGADCSEAEDQQVPLLNCKSDLFCARKKEEKRKTLPYI